MMVALAAIMIGLIYASIAHVIESEAFHSVSAWVGGGLGLFVMGWLIWRATMARPSRPNCGMNKLQRRPDRHDPDVNSWRIFHCLECQRSARITKLGSD